VVLPPEVLRRIGLCKVPVAVRKVVRRECDDEKEVSGDA